MNVRFKAPITIRYAQVSATDGSQPFRFGNRANIIGSWLPPLIFR